MRRHALMSFFLALLIAPLPMLTVPSAAAEAESRETHPVPGPAKGVMGDDLAEVSVPEGCVFFDGKDAAALLEEMGNISTEAEIGLVASTREDASWFVVYEYFPVGYIRDDEKNDLDADAILANIKEGTEESNKIRKERDIPALHVTGWHTPPYYDEASHNLRWATLAEDEEGGKSLNYNTRILGRNGYISAVVVADPEQFDLVRKEAEGIITATSFQSGNRYAEFVEGDKVAAYGLTALVAGGAGAAAAKLGLFQVIGKFFKVIVVGVIAGAGAVWGFIRKLAGRGKDAGGPGVS